MGIFQRARFAGVGRRHRVPPAGLQMLHGPGPQAVFEDSAHMMYAELPDPHLAGRSM
jgi:hypothetical protein